MKPTASTEKPVLLRWTQFGSNPHGHGAERRSAQVREIFENAGWDIHDIKPDGRRPRFAYLRGLLARRRLPGRPLLNRGSPGLIGYYDAFYRRELSAFRGHRVALWECTYDDLFAAIAHELGYRVIALPHNLETLGDAPEFARMRAPALKGLAAEVRRLARSDHRFMIAREEQWFLEAQGVACDFLPYRPAAAAAERLGALRAGRTATARGPVLVLGSALNPLTAEGMTLLAAQLARCAPAGMEIWIAGHNTERIRSALPDDPRLRFLGPLDTKALESTLARAGMIAVLQRGGAGALTRIPEALLAGLPVIGNPNALRSAWDLPGVHPFASDDELRAILARPLPVPPPPPSIADAEARLVAAATRDA